MSQNLDKNPDQLLTLIERDSQRGKEGKLKIFLGMAAGVGKTFAMLKAARLATRRGRDVVVGLVEHHGRKETAELLEGLELLPRRSLTYKGVEIFEFDLDAVLARNPDIVLIDELAHTNALGSRHSKRYLDVFEVLKAGIDVYTTLNVQHVESRVSTVEDITHVAVHETIPDLVLDRADDIVLIDLPPEELLNRLEEGLIYPKDSAALAAQNFFQKGSLTALRELALRVAAERVDRELRDYKTLHGIDGVWKSSGRLMVAIFASPYSEALIRWTRRVADLLGVTWIGAYVESDQHAGGFDERLLTKAIALVRQLGGELVSTRDDDPAEGLLRIARQNNVTQIIVGKSYRGFFWNLLSGGSLVSRLLRKSGDIDIYAVSTSRSKTRQLFKKKLRRSHSSVQASHAGWVVAITLGTWAASALAAPVIGYMAVGIVFLLAVSLAGMFLSRGAVFCLAFLFSAIHNYFFIPPRFSWSVSKPEDLMLHLMFFIAAAVVGHLTTRLARKERVLRSREERTEQLYLLAKETAASQSVQELLAKAQAHLERAFGNDVVFILKGFANRSAKALLGDEKEIAVANWVLENDQAAGYSTETLSASQYTFAPIKGRTDTLGVFGILLGKSGEALSSDQMALLDAFLHQIALGLEREVYHGRVKDLLLVEETQKLYKSLLDCVSHELKTPLAAIKGSASALLDPLTRQAGGATEELAREILEGSDRLEKLVENLLDMTRIESGMMKPKRILCDVADLVGTAVRSQSSHLHCRKLEIDIASSLPPIRCDPVLFHQALGNILNNALRYTPEDTPIVISAKTSVQGVEIVVRDFGPGLPEDHPERVFEKFYRGNQAKAGGVGIGLSIAKGFIEAQGGQLVAENHPKGGAIFRIILPESRP